ncbi:division/cell wall cluster transcriptional repressor MraZ [Geobacter sp. FeAm09]|uniref:division/cell wall cluster transcriptional repressor MraZ n=1 Tax=Geobacter sp. FeAm09 TaxID=2597769 RepID=UPI0011ED29A9|nr:division/cell wall cluster transcriptional repressor MraZ [Geobacter sp. FeAm09]QEM70085.1 division/cell wall cluster transcriptional repressor MraZ [Geobacter sp. FeAm09]
MDIFGGETPSTIDGKGRTCIPAKFRDALVSPSEDARFIITKAAPVDLGDGTFGRGLSVYPLDAWSGIKKKILANEGGFTSAQLNSIKRQIINPAEECSADKLGRVLIPSALRLHAELERDIWFVGMGQRFDIWNKGTYSRINAQDEKNFPLDSEALAAMGV